jgi:hypothetical protein
LADKRAHEALLAQRERDLARREAQTAGHVVTGSAMPTHVIGERAPEAQPNTAPQDSQSKIFEALHSAQTQSLNNINEFMRKSIQSVAASTNQSLNESYIANAIAEYYMNGSVKPDVGRSMESTQLKKLTAEMVTDNINKVFDEWLHEN